MPPIVVLLLVLIVIGGVVVFWWLWNHTMPEVFGLKPITYRQAFQPLIIAALLGRVFGPWPF